MRALVILIIAALFAIYHFATTRALGHAAGVLVPGAPEQTDVSLPSIADRDFTLQPRARFTADARVLSTERYHLGKLAGVAPLDIAVGWGRMSDSAVLAKLEITQGNRFYYWHYDEGPPIPREEIISHSANWHLLPASDAVWHALRGVRVGEIVHLEGLLVDVQNPEMGVMRTSMTRDDTGAGACEVIYVESAELRDN
jgi:hypothetical protein